MRVSDNSSALKRDLVRLRGDAATLYRHYAGAPAFSMELSGLAKGILLNARHEDRAWVRSEIDEIASAYGLVPGTWLDGCE